VVVMCRTLYASTQKNAYKTHANRSATNTLSDETSELGISVPCVWG
jgi:hypothetical protein